MDRETGVRRGLAFLLARVLLGLMFFMTGMYKLFEMGPVEHVRRFFLEAYADTFLPIWSLWLVGIAIPFVEFVAGGLVLLGFRTREALIALGCVLVIVTFGHLLKEPFFRFDTHVMPRAILLLVILATPVEYDRFSLDHLVRMRTGS